LALCQYISDYFLITFVDCGFTHKKRSISTSLSSTTQGDTHEAAIKHDPAQNSYASGELNGSDMML